MTPTSRDLIIMSHIADGLTAVEIGAKLNRSQRTIEVHLRRMRREVGAVNTAQLVAVWFRKKLDLLIYHKNFSV